MSKTITPIQYQGRSCPAVLAQLDVVSVDGNAHQISATPIACIYALLHNVSNADISFGANSDADFYTLAAGASYALGSGGMAFDLGQLYYKTSGAGKTLSILYL